MKKILISSDRYETRVAIVEEGDPIVIDVDRKVLDLDVPAEEIARRLERWTPPEPRYRSGVLAKYAALVSSASFGAVTTGVKLADRLARVGR